MVVLLFASALSANAMAFKAEESYCSVFVVYSGNSLGSGFSIGKDCIVTNAHVITNPKNVRIKTYDGTEYIAQILGLDQEQDIAVLGVAKANFPYLTVNTTTNIGDDIYAIGAPKSMSYTLTKGIISAKEREIGNYKYIQIDAAINDGNSGGPLLNNTGQVIGVNTLKMMDSEGIGLAIPISRVCDYLKTLQIDLDEKGNVSGEIELPATEAPSSEEQENSNSNNTVKKEVKFPQITIIAFIIAGISIAVNIVLLIMLIYQKRKNLNIKYDPRERMDFDIEILE